MLSNTLRFFSSLLYHYSMLRFNCSARARFAKKEKSPNINMKRKRFPFLLHFFLIRSFFNKFSCENTFSRCHVVLSTHTRTYWLMENYFSCFLVFSMLCFARGNFGRFLLLCSSNGDGMSGGTEVDLGSWFFSLGFGEDFRFSPNMRIIRKFWIFWREIFILIFRFLPPS